MSTEKGAEGLPAFRCEVTFSLLKCFTKTEMTFQVSLLYLNSAPACLSELLMSFVYFRLMVLKRVLVHTELNDDALDFLQQQSHDNPYPPPNTCPFSKRLITATLH